jgi:hypothetical protein
MKTLTSLAAAALLGIIGLSMAQSMQAPMKPPASAAAMPLVNETYARSTPPPGWASCGTGTFLTWRCRQ